jgi:hypothetical protein
MLPPYIPDLRFSPSGVTGEVLSRRWISIPEAPIWIIDHPAADCQGSNDAQIVPGADHPIKGVTLVGEPSVARQHAVSAWEKSAAIQSCKTYTGAKTSTNLY